MPRRTYNPKAGRRRPAAGANADTLRYLEDQMRRLAEERRHDERKYR